MDDEEVDVTQEQYERLPALAREVVDVDRRIRALWDESTFDFKNAEEWRRLKRIKADVVRGMAGIYGPLKGKNGGGAVA